MKYTLYKNNYIKLLLHKKTMNDIYLNYKKESL